MSSDRELLELAAKAAGVKLIFPGEGVGGRDPRNAETIDVWNPLTDDGDALRLAVKLSISIDFDDDLECVKNPKVNYVFGTGGQHENYEGDKSAAARRLIVRVAAEIGRAMP